MSAAAWIFLVAGTWFAALCLLTDLDAGKAWDAVTKAPKGSAVRDTRERLAQQLDDRARHLLWVAVGLWVVGFGVGAVAW